ncbi:Protein N-acetyltransferase, RimJ/RimL family [Klenkia soli]|uniref:Protein N-acetyltransferase, RimJ/RimL family n=1 Tax=Klenkia soli TaxID=1052260 RepID=A0A1H0R556_9ACTN|nr:GNAT family N-acetyltransferase [Klenkia soli]SDP24186.1 Protein N-acetyltransferase, RimJ/RimL family [Klenkia soli]
MAIDGRRRLVPPRALLPVPGPGTGVVVPPLFTPRLRLRPVRPADGDAVVALHGDPEVMRHLGTGRPVPPARVRGLDLPRLLADHGPVPLGYWAAEDRATDAFVGWFELRPMVTDPLVSVELGYRLRRASWGRGLATEGARALVDAVFTGTGTDEVVATTLAVNTGSRRVMEKLGMTWRRTYTEDRTAPITGAELGEVEYALARTDWRPLRPEPFHRRQPRRWPGRRP